MDLTTTAQAIQIVQQVSQASASPATAIAAGIALAHTYEPLSDKVSAMFRPYLPALICFGSAALPILQGGGDWKVAAQNGAMALAAAYITHATTFASSVPANG